tara:strand:- start:18 stop:1049 length:1032 start_codon:yes stop_codon:yes gene_type:complete
MKLPKLPKYTAHTNLQKLVELNTYDSTLKGIEPKTGKAYDIHTWNMLMTPEGASQLLAVKFHNRPKSPSHIKRLVADMKNDRWHTSYEPVKIDVDYKLSDGQHRLEAIKESKLTIPVVIYYPVVEEQYKYIDQGLKRTGGHQIHMQGISDAPLIASGLKSIYTFVEGKDTAPSLDVLDDYKILYLKDLQANKSFIKTIKKDKSKRLNAGEVLALITILKDFYSNDIVDNYFEQVFYPTLSVLEEKFHPITRVHKNATDLAQKLIDRNIGGSHFNREMLTSLYFGFIAYSKGNKLRSFAKDSLDQHVEIINSGKLSFNRRMEDFANNKIVGNENKINKNNKIKI